MTQKLNGQVPDTELRNGETHRVEFGGMKGYVTVNVDGDGIPFEVFIHGFGQYGSTMSGWVDTLSILLSVCLQNGVTIEKLSNRFEELTFDPQGTTDNDLIGECQSLPHYVIEYIKARYPTKEEAHA